MEGIHYIDPNKDVVTIDEMNIDGEKSVGYSASKGRTESLPIVDISSPDCFAAIDQYISEADGEMKTKYYILQSIDSFYNPWGMFQEGTRNKFAKNKGKKVWELKEVSEKAFEYYIQFLKTRNSGHLINAERVSRHG